MGTHDDLLARFAPALRYDSNEQFFADSAAQYTDAPGMQLRRVPNLAKAGAVIASAEPAGNEDRLSLGYLGPKTYGGGAKVEKTDVLGVRGRDYRAQYVRLRTARPDLNNRIYARAAEVNGRLWLQYWVWYFYNDYQLALGFGTHEGDWECIQLRMGIDGDVPDVAVYAQHRHGEKRPWAQVERLRGTDTPVVYVARGSHAAYFEAGYHQTEAWYDIADGKRPAPKLTVEIVSDATHPWMRWPGRWGDTTPRDRKLDLDQSSPTGPGTKKHWRNPDSLLDNAKASVLRAPPRAPDVRLARGKGNRLVIDYDFSARTISPRALVVTV
ncbi:MAG: Vps62-related protein, partial [Solirubrobacteraceae bacterium]